MEILLVAVIALGNIACFIVGAKVSQQAHRGEEIKLPKVSVTGAIRHRRENKETELERERIDTILRNIDQYDGSENCQVDVPSGVSEWM